MIAYSAYKSYKNHQDKKKAATFSQQHGQPQYQQSPQQSFQQPPQQQYQTQPQYSTGGPQGSAPNYSRK